MGIQRKDTKDKFGNISRTYILPNGQKVPSVTSILSIIGKPALIGWAAKVERELVKEVSAEVHQEFPNTTAVQFLIKLDEHLGKKKAFKREIEKAADIGSQAHKWIEWSLKKELNINVGLEPKINETAQISVDAWEIWRKKVNLKPLVVEQMVYSVTHGYAGTMDLNAIVEDQESVLDWKTSKAVYPEMFLQNISYRKAWTEMGKGNPITGHIVRLPKLKNDPEFEVIQVLENGLFEIFLYAKKIWEWNKQNEERREEEQDWLEQLIK